jgi:hypothetical protein
MSPFRSWVGRLVSVPLVVGILLPLPSRVVIAAEPSIGWTVSVPGTGVSIAFVEKVGGYLYVGGHADGTVEGEQRVGGLDAFVAKLDLSGEMVWARQFGTQDTDLLLGFDVTHAGILVGGSTYGAFPGFTNAGGGHTTDAFVASLDLDGDIRWLRQFGDLRADAVAAVAIGPGGELYAAGSKASTASGFIRRYDADGDRMWNQSMQARNDLLGHLQPAWPVAIDADVVGPVITGHAKGAMVDGVDRHGSDTWLRRLRADGSVLWTRQLLPDGVGVTNSPFAVAINRSGIALSGSYLNTPYLRRYSLAGTLEWEQERHVSALHGECDDFSTAGNDNGRSAEPPTWFGGQAGRLDPAGDLAWQVTQAAGDQDEWQYLDIDTAAGVAYVVRQHEEFDDPTVTTFDIARIDDVPPVDCPAVDLLANGSFELDEDADGKPDSWSATRHFRRSDDVVHNGSFSGRWLGAANGDGASHQRRAVTPGARYAFSAWVNVPRTDDQFTFTISLQWRSSTGVLGSSVVRIFRDDTAGDWVRVSGLVDAPAAATRVRVSMAATSLRGPIYVDRVRLVLPS